MEILPGLREIGTAAPVIKKYIKYPSWVAKNKIRGILRQPISKNKIPSYKVGQDPMQEGLCGGNTANQNPLIENAPVNRTPNPFFTEPELAGILADE